ncbi:Sporulation kinase E [Symmachiella macrocystis]|uniref:histidine kinase n=1 Tax=Symmachiella macrocystis TaxID=2527985 RepID=A0A5C6BP20_9PLAN|nr:ATP-binding protein [Symmachiella macrocystis]TWU13507.1 Sporulation kinase E [Symmachiella macrocystis]
MAAESMNAAEQQRLLDQYEEIAALAGGLAHEIKNPLSTILLSLELLQEDIVESEVANGHRMLRKVETVQRECQHLQSILEEFLNFARMGEIDLAPADLNEVISEFVEFYKAEAAEQNVEISPHFQSNIPHVRLDRALFRQVLMNFALNAQQAMPEGGLLELQTYARDGEVLLDLIDNGVGMSPATVEKMFQVFYSTKSGGSGLGLPTARKIVQAHRGRIAVDSEPGRGTRFTIALPAAD